jgi:hypothetical protein
VIVEGHLEIDLGTLLADLGCREVCPPMGHMDRVVFHQPDISVDAGAGIPAGGIVGIIEADCQDILPADLEVGGEVEP